MSADRVSGVSGMSGRHPIFVIRNVRSGLLVPETLRAKAEPLDFGSYEEAQRWLVHIDAPLADFQIEEVRDV